jgi:pantoate kinase
VAFAPSAITNFFAIDYDSSPHPTGATGGGYILAKGAWTTAIQSPGSDGLLVTSVNGDRSYDARTTRRAVSLLLSEYDCVFGRLELDQVVETPIGSGFGASAASATSAVYAAADAVGLHKPKKELALYAHRAEILEQTGLGTVSVVYDSVGAGAITSSGVPGEAKFITVDVPKDVRLVTAFIAPYDKKDALSSTVMTERINSLGNEALRRFVSDPSLDSLASEGERFSKNLGLETPEIQKLISTAKSAGATHASQNMIGYSVHSLVHVENRRKVVNALRDYSSEVRVDAFELGRTRAGVRKPSRRSQGPS